MSPKVIDANTLFGTYPRRKVDASPRSLISLLKKNGVDLALTVSMKGIFYDYAKGNLETLEVCSGENMLVPAATIDPRKYYGDKGEISELVRRGFKLIRVFPEYQGWPVDYAPLKRLMRELDSEAVPLMITSHAYGMATKIVELTSSFSFPVILNSIGYWTMSEVIAVMRENSQVYIETHQLDSPDCMEILCEEVGADRLVFGSNSPLTYFLSPYLTLKNSDIPESDKALILGENIERLLGGKLK